MESELCETGTGGGLLAGDGPCAAEAKWAVLVDDRVVPAPRQKVLGRLIKVQAGVAADRVLVRDHNSPNDVIIDDNQEVDLAHGNSFYTLSACDVTPRGSCSAPAKLAFFVDDKPEITTRPDQTGQSLRDLFNLPANSHLVRDLEGGTDREVALNDQFRHSDGPVYFTRKVVAKLQITVNARPFTEADGVKSKMLGEDIARLVFPECPTETTVWFVSDGNREVGLTETIHIKGCEVFDVVRKKVDGGFEMDRISRELAELRSTGQEVTLVDAPQSVIYRQLRTRPGSHLPGTDVLVPIPSAYPGQMLDWAYLPQGSPLIGKVKGSPQNVLITADGRVWQQISYHPHSGGGGPKWDPTLHGIHTYLAELLTWLYAAN